MIVMYDLYTSFLSNPSLIDNGLVCKPVAYNAIPFEERRIVESANPLIIQKDAFQRCERVHFTWNGGQVDVTLYLLHGDGIKLPLLNHILFKLSAFLWLVHCGQATKMRIILTGFKKKKRLPLNSGQTLTPLHVNGGATYTLHDHSKVIIVYRYEEFYKVLLHELFHYYNYDAFLSSKDNPLVQKHEWKIAKAFNVETPILSLHEAYNDFLTCVYSTGFHILFKSRGRITKREFTKQFKQGLNHVESYLFETACCILRYFNANKPFQENTPVFSYYILKSLLFKHRDRVIEVHEDSQKLIDILNVDDIRKHIYAHKTTSRKKSLRMFPFDL